MHGSCTHCKYYYYLQRKPKVLLMDEATASIDEKTDETIQTMIRK